MKQTKLVATARANMAENRSLRLSSNEGLRFEVNEKLNSTQAAMENAVNAAERPFMTRSFFQVFFNHERNGYISEDSRDNCGRPYHCGARIVDCLLQKSS